MSARAGEVGGSGDREIGRRQGEETTLLGRLQDRLRKDAIPALLLTDITNIQWLSGFTGSSAFVIVTPADALFITDSRYTVQSREEVEGIGIEIFAAPVKAIDFIKLHVERMGLTKLGVEAANLSFATYEDYQKKFAPVELFPVTNVLEPLRLVKDENEIARVRSACALADKCFEHVIRLIQPGVSEYDISLDIEFFFRRNGAGIAFPPIVVSGERSARPHGRASEKKLERGDFVTMDFGATLEGYNSDITRTVVVEEASERHREVYEMVLKSQLAALEMMKPGVRAADVDRRTREILDEKGLAGYFGHGLGHSLGRSVHDGGGMNASSTSILEPGQVWTVEPGVYIEGFGGVRIEDDVVVTEDGIEILTHSPKELIILPARA